MHELTCVGALALEQSRWNGLCSRCCSSPSKMQTTLSKRWRLADTKPGPAATCKVQGLVATLLEVGDVQNAWHGSVPSNNSLPSDCNQGALLHSARPCSQKRATILLQSLGWQHCKLIVMHHGFPKFMLCCRDWA